MSQATANTTTTSPATACSRRRRLHEAALLPRPGARCAGPASRAGVPRRQGTPAQPAAARLGHRVRARRRGAPARGVPITTTSRRRPRRSSSRPAQRSTATATRSSCATRARSSIDALLCDDDLAAIPESTTVAVYLTLCYHEEPIDPSRPLLAAAAASRSRLASTAACARPTASARRRRAPDPGPSCEPCCGGCGDACLELARSSTSTPGDELRRRRPRTSSGRRPLARHDLTEIAAINWVHGATYTREDATKLLADGHRGALLARDPSRVAASRGWSS